MNELELLKKYIFDNLEENETLTFNKCMPIMENCCAPSLNEYIDLNKVDNRFQKMLFKFIDRKNLKDSEVYNKVNIDRRLFSKIRSNADYHPSRETVILLGLALELNLDDFLSFMECASYSLPKNNIYDLIIRFCFINKIYNVSKVNDLLYNYNCKTL